MLIVLLGALVAWQLGRKGGTGSTTGETVGSSAHAGGSRTGVTKSRAPAAPASLAGRVTRKADGAGVPGAIVSLGRAELDTMFGGGDEETITVTTDPQGAWSAPSVPPGRYMIAATAKGLVPASLDKLVVAEGEHRTGVDLALESGGTRVSGTISDVGGGPVPGARISFARDRDTPFGSPELIALAGADGTYELTLGAGDYTAKVTHEDYTRAARDVEVAGTPLTVDFVLSPGGAIRGVVVTRDGAPLPGAMVIASAGRRRGGNGGTTRTSDKGEFALHSLGSGAISITAAGRGFASEEPTVVELGIGEQVEGVRVIVDRAFSISGTVVETGTTKGIPGVRLGVFSIASGQMAMAPDPSDADGTFEIVGVRPANYMMFAIGETTMPEIGKPVEVVDQDITGLTIEMGSGVTVSGRVEPGAIAEISIAPTQVGIGNVFEAVKALLVRAQSDPTGAFVLHHVPPGSFTLEAKVVDGRAGRLPLLVAKADKTDVVVKLEPRAQVSGKVVDDKGAPVARVRVTVSPKGDADKGFSMSMSPNSERGALTGSDGAFRVLGLDEGVHEIEVADDQGQIPFADAAHKAKPKEPVELVLAKAEQRTGVTLTIEARDGVIKGVVLGADGRPVADAWVTASVEREGREELVMEGETEIMDRGGKPPTLTGSDGAFTFANLRRAEYTLVAETAKGTARVEQKAVKIGASVTLTLAPLGSLTGHVTINGAPATSYMLSCDRTGSMPRRFASPDGAYTMDRIPPGHVTCTANADAGRGTAEIDVPAGPATLDLALTPWATITGTVVSVLTGQPIAGLKLIASGNDFSAGAMTDTLTGKGPTSDAAGRFTVPQVAAGKGSLSVMPKDAGFVELARRDYEVTPGQRLDLGTIKVVPPRTGDAGTLGLSIELTLDDKGDALVVTAVKPGGPAEVGGVRIGDKLVAINGVPVATLTPKLAQTLVSSGSVTIDQRYQLTLDRSGTAVEVVLVGVRW
ncbi:MAG: carboxypeptidase regulatory-like domain-containing protein [Myxococcales bacterium]|nr:carboxypeptidase regulatory-like domain-containing protein [Myxococcales bacterium]